MSLLAQISRFTATEVLTPYIYLFYIAFGVAFLFTPLMRSVATYFGIVDKPDRIRKMHAEPIPYLGGVAVFLGWMAALAMAQFMRHHITGQPAPRVHLSIIFGGLLIIVLGLWDDMKHIRPRMKIIGQVLAAALLIGDGIGTQCLQHLVDPVSAMFTARFGWPAIPTEFTTVLSSIFVIAAVVACCNASNLMDGLDGLCGGVTAIIAGGFLFLAVHLATLGGGDNAPWDAERVILGLALMGAILGFLPYNFNPAMIFMGDTGSMFLGYACAVSILLMGQGQHPKWFLASTVIFALPVLDTALAFARRWVNKRPFFSADRFHLHHQLVARGFTVKQTVMISYAMALGFALLGVAIVYMRTRFAGAVYLVTFGTIVVFAYKAGMIHETPRVVRLSTLSRSDELVEKSASAVETASVLEVQRANGGGPATATPAGGGLERMMSDNSGQVG